VLLQHTEAQEVERFRLAFSSSFPVLFGKSTELDPARFVGMEFQPKLPQPFPKILQKTICFGLMRKRKQAVRKGG
jgi:hypothetical protein